jgi:hypothetical protein
VQGKEMERFSMSSADVTFVPPSYRWRSSQK